MRVAVRFALFVLACLAIMTGVASAQAVIAGTVKDGSGAVLPGVTVEASSPALIEKEHTVVTDGTGQYKVVDLRPGTYTVTFTLAGFNTVKREGIELTGAFTATVDAAMTVGAVSETITVTGETPIIDLQNTTQQRVLDHDVIDAIPVARNPFAIANLIPGVSGGGTDAGGSGTINAAAQLSVHGVSAGDQITRQNGVDINAMQSSAYGSRITINMAAVQELAIDTAAASAEEVSGGVRINIIPRNGGNRFSGTFIGAFANSSMQGSNFTQDLKSAGLSVPGSIKQNYDINPGLGGPIQQDKLWFYASVERQLTDNYVPGMFYNLNANNPSLWTYAPDLNHQASNTSSFKGVDGRVTWQVNPKNQVGLTMNYNANCSCPGAVTASLAPEADLAQRFPLQRRFVGDWSNTINNRLLLEAGFNYLYGISVRDFAPGLNPDMIGVTEQSTGLVYRAGSGYRNSPTDAVRSRVALSYVTGAHAFKVGANHNSGFEKNTTFATNSQLAYRFNNGVPNQITLNATPFTSQTNINHDIGLFAQDNWKKGRLTLTYGIRYDYYNAGYPQEHLDIAPLAPTRNITFPEMNGAATYHDIAPKSGVVYDVFGNGKTALRASLNKYEVSLGSAIPGNPDPTVNLVTSTTRSWTDRNGNFIPDCVMLNPAAQTVTGGDICGAWANPAFGNVVIPNATIDPALLHGWGKRGAYWEFATGVQHEILPRVSVDVAYFRRINENFIVTDDRSLAPSDFDAFSITAPVDPRLPNGGGYVVSDLYNLKPAKFGVASSNFVTLDSNYGSQISHWNGVDVNVNARMTNGILVRGGVSTGRTSTDNCAVLAQLPELSPLGGPYCHQDTPFLSRAAGFASYTVPKILVQVAATFQSIPGPQILGNYVATNAVVQPSLGRPLSGGVANVTVDLVGPGHLYGQRLNQVDLRFAKILKYGKTQTRLSIDLYNAFNASAILTENNNYAAWQQPQSIVTARFARLGVQFDF